ncbi:DUF3667 domain-containing protein [Sphingomonas bacterium]|uniref:DUF3667 domain-containing protein n=1 Tax=Sphingomonas bacterium TaxID=1895847 RepID=UPI00345C0CF3
MAGDIATGALLGRAVEPRAGESGGGAAQGVCLNCGTALIGEFCHACGQNGHVHKTLSSIGHDLLHGVFHFEGKVWRTLPMLVAHPGQLTRRYIDGERARFVSPLALFLFFVFLMFATISSLGGASDMNFDATPRSREERIAAVDGNIAKTQAELTKAEGLAAKGGPGAEDAASDIVGLKATLSGLKVARNTIATSKDGHTRVTLSDAKTGWDRLDHGIAKANANPELALYKLQSSAYKYSWALIPISVPFVALIFLWRRKFKLYDHAIFVTYSLSFMLLLVTAVTLLMMIDAPGVITGCLIAFAPPVHLFAQLRGTYGLNWFSSLWRTLALMLFGIITLTLFAMLLLGLGLME